MKVPNQKILCIAALALAAWNVLNGDALQPGDLTAICGDSITEQKEYSVYIADYLLMCQPAPNLCVMQFGWGGETSWTFADRIQHDVFPFHPSVATICYGMNDAGYSETQPDRLANFRAALTRIVTTFKKNGVRHIVLGGPGVVDSDSYTGDVGATVYNRSLGEFNEVAHAIAKEQKVTFADVHANMLSSMARGKEKYGNGYHMVGNDGVHPARSGHLVMAYTFLKALGCQGDIGTIILDMKSGHATATTGHRVVSSTNSMISMESSRYPFCFYGEAQDQESTRGMSDILPFNEELNRLLLFVKSANGVLFKVSWGDSNREFTAEELAKGINLAATFPENPFCKPFKKAEDAVREQQKMDGYLVKEFLHWTPGWSHLLPGNEDAFGRLEIAVTDRAKIAREATTAAITPVKHTIFIEKVQ